MSLIAHYTFPIWLITWNEALALRRLGMSGTTFTAACRRSVSYSKVAPSEKHKAAVNWFNILKDTNLKNLSLRIVCSPFLDL